MNWVAVLWSILSGGSLMLGIMQLFLWQKSNRPAPAYLVLAITALAVAAVALGEWNMMMSRTPAEYTRALRWTHVPLLVLIAGIVAFIRFHFKTGIAWLAWTVIGLRILVLCLNFLIPENINFLEITALKQIPFLGQPVSVVAQAVSNPWTRLNEVSGLLLLLYVLEASRALWRKRGRSNRHKALLAGAGIGGFILFALVHSTLIHYQVIQSPYIVSLAFLGIILPMSNELNDEILATVRLTEHLRQAQQYMTLAASAARLALWTWDIPGDSIWVTEEGRQLYGVPPHTNVTVERFLQTVHPDDRDSVREIMKESMRGGKGYAQDYRILLPDGQIRWISARGTVECDAKGTPRLVRGVSMDNTEHRQAEERARLMVEAAPHAMIMVDSSANMVLVNRQAESLFGYARPEMLGRSIDLLAPGHFQAHHPSVEPGFLAQTATGDMGAGREWSGLRKDGKEVPLEVGLNPIHTSEGIFVLVSLVDLTGRRRAEMEAMEQRDELFHLSRVASLGQLSGSLAHELNQPLGIILSNAQAAQRMLAGPDPDIPELKEILADIVGEDRRAGEVITRLRAMLKRGETCLVPVSLAEVTGDVLRLLRSDLIARGITTRMDLSPGLPTVAGDVVQIQQVLLNLITNACDAMAANPLADRILTIMAKPGKWQVTVTVEDQGCGLPDGDTRRIFQPFYTTKSQGLGIGLPICESIVNAHHGRLWAEPKPQGGTRFHLELQIIGPEA